MASNGGALRNPMRLGSGDTQTHRRHRNATHNPVTMGIKTQGTDRAQVMSRGEGVEDRTTRHDGDPVTRGAIPRTESKPAVGDHDDNEGDPRRTPLLQEHRRIGTPNSRYWRTMTDEGEKRGITGETLEQNTSESS